jgi:hypothetical protein
MPDMENRSRSFPSKPITGREGPQECRIIRSAMFLRASYKEMNEATMLRLRSFVWLSWTPKHHTLRIFLQQNGFSNIIGNEFTTK